MRLIYVNMHPLKNTVDTLQKQGLMSEISIFQKSMALKHPLLSIIALAIMLLHVSNVHAGLFDGLYKLPNAQVMSADNNYQPNIYFLPNTEATTTEGKTVLKKLIASRKNTSIEKDIKLIQQLLLDAVNKKDPVAQAIQGMMYYYGWHSPKSVEAAYELSQQASQQGEAQGDYMLMLLLDKNHIPIKQDLSYSLNLIHKKKTKPQIVTLPNGSSKDLGEAVKGAEGIKLIQSLSGNPERAKLKRIHHYLKRGVDKKHAQSQYRYGDTLSHNVFKPIGIKADDKRAGQYIAQAAEQGWPQALNKLVSFYTLVRGAANHKKAMHYAQQLIDTKDMHYDQAWAIKVRQLFIQKKLDEAKALLAKGWALSKHRSASLAAMHSYFISKDTNDGQQQFLKWGKITHQLQNPNKIDTIAGGLFKQIAEMYFSSKELGTDLKQAKKWLTRSAEEKIGSAYSSLGLICKGVYGGKKDIDCAIENYRKGVALSSPVAMSNLAALYYNGDGVLKNNIKVFELTKKAAFMGFVSSIHLMSIAYKEGIGTQKNVTKCYIWAHLSKARQWQIKNSSKYIHECGQALSLSEKRKLNIEVNRLNIQIPPSTNFKITELN